MRALYLSICFLFSIAICNAQIAPPKQTDTLVITSVKYNYADIDKSNWPCETIYKSTQDIRIGNQTFNIIEAEKVWDVILFSVYDANDPNKKEYELKFIENENRTYVLSFSKYEFGCIKKGHTVTENKTYHTEEAKAVLAGRSVNGTLPRPTYNTPASGKVVVNIWVDNYGTVQKAVAGAEGTSVTDKNLWQAARKAAMGACFNMDADAPALQMGTITYIFKM